MLIVEVFSYTGADTSVINKADCQQQPRLGVCNCTLNKFKGPHSQHPIAIYVKI